MGNVAMPLAKMTCICTIIVFTLGVQTCCAQQQHVPNAKPHAAEVIIQSIDFSQPFAALPAEISLTESTSSATILTSSPKAVFWETNTNCFGNLIFDEPHLEQYGFSLGYKQEFVSATLFFTRAVALPFFRQGRQALRGQ